MDGSSEVRGAHQSSWKLPAQDLSIFLSNYTNDREGRFSSPAEMKELRKSLEARAAAARIKVSRKPERSEQ